MTEVKYNIGGGKEIIAEYDDDGIMEITRECFEALIEKQIPFMPIKMENIYPDNQRKCKCGCFVSTVYKNRGGVTCVFEIAYKYCPNCGQKLEGFKE